jgi:hypothetical protein
MKPMPGRPVSVKVLRAALARPASAGLIADNGGHVPAKIGGPLDEVTWRRLAMVFDRRKLGGRPRDPDRYLLGPVLACGKCGNQLTGEQVRAYNPATGRRDGEPVPYYACANPHKHLPWGGSVTRPCKGVSVSAEDVHELVAVAFAAWMQTPAVQMAAALAAASSPEIASRRAELAARIAETREWMSELYDERTRRILDPARFAQHKAVADAQIAADEAELDALDQADAPGVPWTIGWDELTAAEKLAAVREACQTPIVVRPGNGGARALSAFDRIDLVPRAS